MNVTLSAAATRSSDNEPGADVANRVLVRMCLPLALAVVLPFTTTAADDEFTAVFARATSYVSDFERQFAAVIWREAYEAIDRLPLVRPGR
jgi:hypothetical protein